jgi:glycosyltransferase involved in cell wall biosynthesis
VLLVTWIIFTHSIGLAPRSNSFNHVDVSGLQWQWWRRLRTHGNHVASASVRETWASKPEGICTRLAVLKPDKHRKSLRAGPVPALRDAVTISRRTPATFKPRLSIVAVMLVAADAGGDDDATQKMSESGKIPRKQVIRRHHVGRISAASCTHVTAAMQSLRSPQTLLDFEVEILVIGRRVRWHTRRHACRGIKYFSADSLAATSARSRHARDIGEPARDRFTLNPTGSPDFVLFLHDVDLHATTLENLVLAARGRHADMVSVQPTWLDGSDVVCLASSAQHRHGRMTCQVKGAPILLRVPAWLSQSRLKNWTGAVAELVTAAELHARGHWQVRNGIASLFCAADDPVVVHSLRAHELLVSERGSQTDNGIAPAQNSCDRVRARHPHLQTARAAFCAAYERVKSRDQRRVETMHRGDGPAAAANRVTSGGAVSHSKPDDRKSSFSQRLRRQLLLRTRKAVPSPAVPGFLLIVPWLAHGGADQFNVNLARALTKLGVRVVVVTTLSSANPTSRDFYAITPDVFHLPDLVASPRDTPEILSVFTHLIFSRNVDTVMISHSALGYTLVSHLRNALMAMRYGHVKFVDFVHLEDMGWGDGGYAAISVAHAQYMDHTFAASQHVAAWMKQRGMSLNLAKQLSRGSQWDQAERDESKWGDKVSVAYIGVDTQAIRPLPTHERERVRSKLLMPSLTKIDTNKPIIAYIARMVDQKLPNLFFEIIRQLREERHMDFVSFAIGGGPKLSELRTNVSQHSSLEGALLTLGMLDHNATIRALAVADVMLLPSQNEGISLAVYEAMALGVTPVVSAVGGQCELVADNAGACVPFDSLAGIAAAAQPFVDELERLVSSRELLDRRSRMARLRVEREFDIEKTILALRSGLCGNDLV